MWRAISVWQCHIFNIICKVFDLSSSRKHKPRTTLSTFLKYKFTSRGVIEKFSFTRRIMRWKWWKMKRFIASICAYLNAKLQPKIVNKFNTISLAILFLCSPPENDDKNERSGSWKKVYDPHNLWCSIFFAFASNVIFSLLLIEKLFLFFASLGRRLSANSFVVKLWHLQLSCLLSCVCLKKIFFFIYKSLEKGKKFVIIQLAMKVCLSHANREVFNFQVAAAARKSWRRNKKKVKT